MNKKLLIVEDERLVAEDLKNTVSSFQYDVVGIAATGIDAISMAEQFQPDLILMDIMLEGDMTGIEAAKVIYQKQKTPVIFLTAYADEETLDGAIESDPYAYLIKPFRDRDLKITLKMAFNLINKNK